MKNIHRGFNSWDSNSFITLKKLKTNSGKSDLVLSNALNSHNSRNRHEKFLENKFSISNKSNKSIFKFNKSIFPKTIHNLNY